jgi:hypothetical protein
MAGSSESGEGAHHLAKQFEVRCMLGELPAKQKASAHVDALRLLSWLRGQDLNLRPLGYEPNELPGCSTARKFRKRLGPHRLERCCACDAVYFPAQGICGIAPLYGSTGVGLSSPESPTPAMRPVP